MRFTASLPILAVFAIAACGSEDAQQSGEEMSLEEVADEIGDAPMPEPGEYRSTFELLDFQVPGVDESVTEMVRSSFEAASTQSSNSCITPEQAETAREDMIKGMAEGDCSVTRMEMSGGAIDAAMECAMDGNVNASVTMVGQMGSTGANMEVTSTMPLPGMGDANMRMRITTERIGDCS